MKPALFVLGPSGVGKSHLAQWLAKRGFLYLHIDTDSDRRSFAANGFPAEWDNDPRTFSPDFFVAELRDRLGDGHSGAVVTLPTTYRFAADILAQLSRLGVTPILLWGTREQCMKAAEERINKKNRPFDLPRYDERNEPTFRLYGGREYDTFRVVAFTDDGLRFADPKWVADIMARTANDSGTAGDSRSTRRE